MPHRIVFPVVLPYIPGNVRRAGAPGTTVRPYGARAGQKADLARYTRVYPVPQGGLFSLPVLVLPACTLSKLDKTHGDRDDDGGPSDRDGDRSVQPRRVGRLGPAQRIPRLAFYAPHAGHARAGRCAQRTQGAGKPAGETPLELDPNRQRRRPPKRRLAARGRRGIQRS